jgi:DNA invertase Pin-like site-specific DNA recombinase
MSKKHRVGSENVVIAYVRVSTGKQEIGPEAQKKAIQLWESRNPKARIVDLFEEKDVSGADSVADRLQLSLALARIPEVGAGILLAAKRDRFARDPAVMAAIEGEARVGGAVVRTADGMSDTTGSAGMIQKGIQDIFSAYERELIRERTKAALAVKRARGERVSRYAPYGFRVGTDLLEPNLEEQAVLMRARALRSEGHSFRAIASLLAREGKANRNGHKFSSSAVFHMIASESKVS